MEEPGKKKFGDVVLNIKKVHNILDRVGADISTLKQRMKKSSELHHRSKTESTLATNQRDSTIGFTGDVKGGGEGSTTQSNLQLETKPIHAATFNSSSISLAATDDERPRAVKPVARPRRKSAPPTQRDFNIIEVNSAPEYDHGASPSKVSHGHIHRMRNRFLEVRRSPEGVTALSPRETRSTAIQKHEKLSEPTASSSFHSYGFSNSKIVSPVIRGGGKVKSSILEPSAGTPVKTHHGKSRLPKPRVKSVSQWKPNVKEKSQQNSIQKHFIPKPFVLPYKELKTTDQNRSSPRRSISKTPIFRPANSEVQTKETPNKPSSYLNQGSIETKKIRTEQFPSTSKELKSICPKVLNECCETKSATAVSPTSVTQIKNNLENHQQTSLYEQEGPVAPKHVPHISMSVTEHQLSDPILTGNNTRANEKENKPSKTEEEISRVTLSDQKREVNNCSSNKIDLKSKNNQSDDLDQDISSGQKSSSHQIKTDANEHAVIQESISNDSNVVSTTNTPIPNVLHLVAIPRMANELFDDNAQPSQKMLVKSTDPPSKATEQRIEAINNEETARDIENILTVKVLTVGNVQVKQDDKASESENTELTSQKNCSTHTEGNETPIRNMVMEETDLSAVSLDTSVQNMNENMRLTPEISKVPVDHTAVHSALQDTVCEKERDSFDEIKQSTEKLPKTTDDIVHDTPYSYPRTIKRASPYVRRLVSRFESPPKIIDEVKGVHSQISEMIDRMLRREINKIVQRDLYEHDWHFDAVQNKDEVKEPIFTFEPYCHNSTMQQAASTRNQESAEHPTEQIITSEDLWRIMPDCDVTSNNYPTAATYICVVVIATVILLWLGLSDNAIDTCLRHLEFYLHDVIAFERLEFSTRIF
ncbi:uncharacterized protein LOC101243329 [Ciona intestinalis]